MSAGIDKESMNHVTRDVAVGILEYLHSQRVSYTMASGAIDLAQAILQQLMDKELSTLPLADGITYPFDSDRLVLSTSSLRLGD